MGRKTSMVERGNRSERDDVGDQPSAVADFTRAPFQQELWNAVYKHMSTNSSLKIFWPPFRPMHDCACGNILFWIRGGEALTQCRRTPCRRSWTLPSVKRSLHSMRGGMTKLSDDGFDTRCRTLRGNGGGTGKVGAHHLGRSLDQR